MNGLFSSRFMSNISNAPRSSASVTDEPYAASASSLCTFSENSVASSVPYLNPIAASMSPSAVIPTPVRRPMLLLRAIFSQSFFSAPFTSSLSGSLSIFSWMALIFSSSRSMMSSMMRCALATCSLKSSKSKYASAVNGFTTYE